MDGLNRGKFKVGDRIRLVKNGLRGYIGLDSMIENRECGIITEVHFDARPDCPDFVMFNPDAYHHGSWRCYSDMVELENAYLKGQMVLRIISTRGVANEVGMDVRDYDALDLRGVATKALGYVPRAVTGTKSKIEGPNFCILTRGVARSDNGAVY